MDSGHSRWLKKKQITDLYFKLEMRAHYSELVSHIQTEVAKKRKEKKWKMHLIFTIPIFFFFVSFSPFCFFYFQSDHCFIDASQLWILSMMDFEAVWTSKDARSRWGKDVEVFGIVLINDLTPLRYMYTVRHTFGLALSVLSVEMLCACDGTMFEVALVCLLLAASPFFNET